jgi:ribose transport system permease protein
VTSRPRNPSTKREPQRRPRASKSWERLDGRPADLGTQSPPSSETLRRLTPTLLALRAVQTGPILILCVLVIAMSLAEPLFLTEVNIQNLLGQTAVIALLGIGQLLVILTRGIDLSVGSGMAVTTVAGALVFDTTAGSDLSVVATFLVTGMLLGALNGLIFVLGRIPTAFIVTLATFGAYRGLALILSDSSPVAGVPSVITGAGRGFVGPIPISTIVVLGVAAVALVLTTRMTWGRWIYAVGGNPEAARRMGIPVNKVLISVYVFSGVTMGIAGIVVAGRTGTGFPTAGQLAELDAISAVVIGGASLFGGRGTVMNVLVGALTIGVVRNGLNLMGLSPDVQLIVIAGIIVFAVQLDVVRGRLEEKLRSSRARWEAAA